MKKTIAVIGLVGICFSVLAQPGPLPTPVILGGTASNALYAATAGYSTNLSVQQVAGSNVVGSVSNAVTAQFVSSETISNRVYGTNVGGGVAISVVDFGADSTGAVDSRTAVSNAMRFVSGGGTVTLPKGIYKVAAPLYIPDGVCLQGVGRSGSVLKPTGSFPCLIVSNTVTRWGAKELGIDYTAAGSIDTNAIAIKMVGTAEAYPFFFSIQNVEITAADCGVENSSRAFMGNLDHLYVSSVSGVGVKMIGDVGTTLSFRNCYVNTSVGGGFDIRNIDSLEMVSCAVDHNTNGTALYLQACIGSVDGFFAEANSGGAIISQSGGLMAIKGAAIKGNVIAATSGQEAYLIRVSDAGNMVLSASTTSANTYSGNGATFYGLLSGTDCWVVGAGNSIAAATGTGGTSYGIYANGRVSSLSGAAYFPSLAVQGDSSALGLAVNTSQLVVSNGLVGIGKATPLVPLELKTGNAYFAVDSYPPLAPAVWLASFNSTENGYVPMVFQASKFAAVTGNFGIGTENPATTLHVSGTGITVSNTVAGGAGLVSANGRVVSTNGFSLPAIDNIPTNQIPVSSASYTNWVIANWTNTGPVFVATNTAASGSFLLRVPTTTLSTWP